MPVRSVHVHHTVRVAGVNQEHVAALAEAPDELPPIVVHRESMRVVDGVHRLWAARARGDTDIRAVFVDGDETATFVLAMQLNARHGLPLSHGDRAAAVDRLLSSCPQWSDRRIGAVVGVAHTTVARRRRPTGGAHQSGIGRDGRARPRDPGAGRRRVARMLEERPEASAREIARSVGVSPTTVLDVRRRAAQRLGTDSTSPRPAAVTGQDRQVPASSSAGRPRTADGRSGEAPPGTQPDPVQTLEALRADPSLRYSTAGRTLLGLLSLTMGLRRSRQLASVIPPHSRAALAGLARDSAQQWLRMAAELERVGQENRRATS